MKQNHFQDECVVEIDASLSFDLLCLVDRQKGMAHGIIPNTEAGKSTLGKGFRLFGLQSLLAKKIESASKADKGKKNVSLKHSENVIFEQPGKEIHNQQEYGTSFVVATTGFSSFAPATVTVTKTKCTN